MPPPGANRVKNELAYKAIAVAGTFESGLLVPNIQNPKRIMISSILHI